MNRLKLEDKLDYIGGVLEDINTTLMGDTSNPIYGIRRSLNSTSTAWVRTNEAITLSANATKDGSEVSNDFDAIYPWSDIITVNILDNEVVAKFGDDAFSFDGSNGDVMTYIPPFYFKRWQDASNEYVQIAKHHFGGAMHIGGFYIGRYTTSDGIKSVSGVQSTVNHNIAWFRTESMKKGDKWCQLDWHYFVLQYLYLVEYADGNSQSRLGNGVVGDSAQHSSGELDSLGMRSGCLVNDNKHSVMYRGIENPFGNIWQFVDGICIKDWQTYVCYDHLNYENDKFTEPYKPLSYVNLNTDGSPKVLGCDNDNMLLGICTSIGTSSYGDYYWQNSGNRIVLCGGNWHNGTSAGFFSLLCNNASSNSSASIGSRLLKIR